MSSSRAHLNFVPLAAMAVVALAGARTPAEGSDPIPILRGNRVLSPGPRALGFDGFTADPSSIGNFKGVIGLAYLRGRVRDTAGHRWVMENDIRVFQGDYVAADGVQQRGTFGFV